MTPHRDPASEPAPLYDVISFLPYADGEALKLRTAMTLGDDFTVRAMSSRSAWRDPARVLGLDPERAADRAAEILRRTPSAIDAAIDGLSPEDRRSCALLPLSRSVRSLSDQVMTALTAN